MRAHLLIGPGCSLPPGRYAYDPRAHRAHRRGPAPDGVSPGVLVVLTVAASRTVAHYGHRAWPLLLLDTGHAAAALALAWPPPPTYWSASTRTPPSSPPPPDCPQPRAGRTTGPEPSRNCPSQPSG
ncbi:hypothetical protein [Streptomyces anulatus]|uniref:hypothetical protein n=1 Tax=Streptomyces anulatus TaxID=1892 RepID=UPI003D81705F